MSRHRSASQSANSPGLLNPLASPALLVLASTAEGTRTTPSPCQQPRHFGVPVAMEKPSPLPFLGTAYSLVYPHGDRLAPAGRDYPPQLLPLPAPFAHPSLERGGAGMLSYGALHPFAPFHLADDVECFPGGFLAGKQPKGRSGSELPQVCCLALKKEMETQRHLGSIPSSGRGLGFRGYSRSVWESGLLASLSSSATDSPRDPSRCCASVSPRAKRGGMIPQLHNQRGEGGCRGTDRSGFAFLAQGM
uniref:Uncharacterized protein n=1 Tax=Pelusios castaneus TaxID=367368 RepID=A0A8C8SM84_9SAUR